MNKYQLSAFASLLTAGLGGLGLYYTRQGVFKPDISDGLGYTISGFFLLLGLLLFVELLARYWRVYPFRWLRQRGLFRSVIHFDWTGDSPAANLLKSLFFMGILAFMILLLWNTTEVGKRGINFYIPIGFLGFFFFIFFVNFLRWLWISIRG